MGFILSVIRVVLGIWCIQLGWNWFIVKGDISSFHMTFSSAGYIYLFLSLVIGVTSSQSAIEEIEKEDVIKHKIVAVAGTSLAILISWIIQMILF